MGNNIKNDNINKYIHPRLGQIRRIQQQQNSQQFIQYCTGVQSQKFFEEWQKDLKAFKQYQGSQYLFLPISYQFDKKAMCGTGGNVNMKFNDYMFVLAPQIRNRKQIKRPFQQKEIWYLLYHLVKIGKQMEKKQCKIGDVRPDNILINQDGQIQIICTVSWPGNPDNYQLSMQDSDARVFLSPQQCNSKSRKKSIVYPSHLSQNISQVFSMGLTVLQAGTLNDSYQLYLQTPQLRFNQFKVRQYYDIFQNRYSKQLGIILQQMIRISPQKRIKCSIIYDLLSPFQDDILKLNQFHLDKNKLYQVISHHQKQKIKSSHKNSLAIDTSAKISYKNINQISPSQSLVQTPTSQQIQIHQVQQPIGSSNFYPNNIQSNYIDPYIVMLPQSQKQVNNYYSTVYRPRPQLSRNPVVVFREMNPKVYQQQNNFSHSDYR